MSVPVGSESPVTLRVTVQRAPGSNVDFTTITAATVRVRIPKTTTSPDEVVDLH